MSRSAGRVVRMATTLKPVRGTEGARAILYHRDAGGRLIAETLVTGEKLREYVYLGEKLVALDGRP